MFFPPWYVLVLAVVLDFLFGDPRWLFHPIRWMGQAIVFFEPHFRKLKLPLIFSGALMAVFLILTVFVLTSGILFFLGQISPLLALVVQVILVYYTLSARSLASEAMAVDRALQKSGLDAARKKLAWIVGRDVTRLSEQGVKRAAVETVAENLVDGFVAPLLYAALGGAPLAMAYKMVNTLDSMVGYKNDRYYEFGRIAARIDDVANWIPARTSVPVIAVAALLMGHDGKQALATALAEGRNHSSPNAGFSEAAFAGAMAIRLGGPNVYHGKLVEKPYIGTSFGRIRDDGVRQACRLMLFTALLWSALMALMVGAF